MVWAVKFESEFGQFFPMGDYPELMTRLAEYYKNSMGAEERETFPAATSYAYEVFCKFRNEIGRLRPGSQHILQPIAEHEWPREFQAERRIRALASLFTTVNMVLTIDDSLRSVIERIEPGMHQFRPVVVRQPNGDIVPGSFSTLVINQFRDSFIPDSATEGELWVWEEQRNDAGTYVRTGDYTCRARERADFAALTFSRSAIRGAHLWREPRLSSAIFFISDELREAIKAAGLKIPPHFQSKEVA